MNDIVERLRAEATDNRRYEVNGTLAVEAADEITRLRAENERLGAALKPFVCDCEGEAICIGECMHRNARAALDGQTAPGKEEA